MKFKSELTLGKKSAMNMKNIYWMLIAGVCVTMCMMHPVFAATGGDIFTVIGDIAGKVYSAVVKLSTPFLGAVIGVSQLVYMFSGNPKTAEPAKDWRNRAIIGWLVINGIGIVLTTLTGWIGSGGAITI